MVSTDAFKALTRFAIGAAAGAYNTYKQGGNWEKQAEGVSMELALTGTAIDIAGEPIGTFLLVFNPPWLDSVSC